MNQQNNPYAFYQPNQLPINQVQDYQILGSNFDASSAYVSPLSPLPISSVNQNAPAFNLQSQQPQPQNVYANFQTNQLPPQGFQPKYRKVNQSIFDQINYIRLENINLLKFHSNISFLKIIK